MSERLEVSLLGQIGLVTDESGFTRKGIRLNTATLYKQQKFNLLREENEGYSGLINELICGMGPPICAVRGSPGPVRVVEQENAEERNRRAMRVMNNISALIGYFDLDPSRVLDIVLDIFSSNVVRHWPFFLALLSASPWRSVKGKTSKGRSGDGSDAMDVDMSAEDLFGPVDVSVKGDQGHDVCAQVLGFKFGYYQLQDVTDRVPEELYLTAAILIREGHVRFTDLYTHLSPDEKGMASLHEKYKQSMSDKVMSAKGNALSMAAPLTEEEGLSGSGADTKDNGGKAGTNALLEPPNQVLGLLKALLGIGHLKCALFILGRYPWLCGAYPHVADLYSRLLDVIIEPAYSTISLATQVPVASNNALATPRLRYDTKRQELVEGPVSSLRLTSQAPEPLPTLTNRFVYFYGNWKQDLPLCTPSTLLPQFVPLLRVLGPHLYRNPVLFQRICRLGKIAIRTAPTESHDRAAWLEVVRNTLLPALTMTAGNSGLVSEVWVVLRQLPYTERYNLYGEWKYSLYRRPELRARQAETEKEAKGILKRISSDNVKMSGRSLAKSSHTNPTIFFTVALNQIQSYSNLIAPIVESAKYLTHLEYDVFGFNLIDALSNPEKERTKQDGTNVSMWLQSLAAFTGTLYRRYAMMDCSPVLQYIANQLKENNSKDLVIIRELILKMAGIEPLANLSDAQVAALTGGRLLRMEAMMVANASVATPARIQFRKSGSRLLQALTESRMAIPLLVLIAQQRQACIHLVPSGEAHLKYLGNLFDTCQEVLFQYVEFLHNQLEPQAYSDLVPRLHDLCTRFAVEPAIAFHIARPRLVLNLRTIEAKENEERLRKEVLASKMKSSTKEALPEKEDEKEPDVTMDDGETGSKDVGEVENAKEAGEKPNGDLDEREQEEVVQQIWKAGLAEAVKAADAVLPDGAKEVIGVHFYSTFWQLSLADVTVPTERYEQELRALQVIVDQNPEGGRKSIHKARIQAQDMLNQLRTELKEQTLSHQATRKRLQVEKDHWFPNEQGRSDIVYQMMQHCFVPRALLSPTDAIFAGRFLRLMHSLGTRNFSSLTAYDKIVLDQVAPLVFSCTENEVRNYARFLLVILTDLNRWFKEEELYSKEAIGDNLPGFQMRWTDRHGGEPVPPGDLLKHETYKTVMLKWHSMLRSIFRECLSSKEYMRIRNTIVIMTRISSQFPLFDLHGIDLLEGVTMMTQDEDRGDLKILGQGLLATLKKQQKGWIMRKTKKVVVAETGAGKEAAPATGPGDKGEAARKASSVASPAVTSSASTTEENKAVGSAKESSASPKTTQEPGEASPAREPSGSSRPSLSRSATSTTAANRSSSNNAPSPSVLAARQAALESMNSGMNPPKTVASTASAQASRDRQGSSSYRDREVSNSSSRLRDREAEEARSQAASPRQVVSSRETSPGTASSSTRGGANEASDPKKSSRQVSRAGSRNGSRAGSEEPGGRREASANSSSRSERERERERDREREKSSSSRRDRDRDRDGRERSRRERERENVGSDRVDREGEGRAREARSREQEREGERTMRKAVDVRVEEERRPVPTGPRLATDSGRRSSDYDRDRRDAHDSPRLQPTAAPPSGPGASRLGREVLPDSPAPVATPAQEREAREDSEGAGLGGKKRSLADRLSASEASLAPTNGNAAPTSRPPALEGRRTDDEANKRPRINRNRFTDEEQAPNGEMQKSRPSTPSEQGISIHGQGRTGGPPAYNRRDSRTSSMGGRGGPGSHYDSAGHRNDRERERERAVSSGTARGGGGGGGGREREQRRKDRRSGHD